ncbi:hypothetical protein [Metabacillus rhizolycopersici]|uniref:Uncharacterized protein n=1 Tax=Metabacillus rhizolycopersici TaxID=2875709 RepID=A0ABS7UTN8_9BACI|nr:hypothetical protein [Metabacillus rhizolycopersici]MBZ5751672.1 hypothetical protein [Metabacillus rhizolycopersici]
MGALFELLSSIGTLLLPFIKEVTEEEIDKNVKFSKQYQWFLKHWDDDKFKRLINEDVDVRYVIGKFNRKEMERISYHQKYQMKINKILLTKTNYPT